MCYTDSDDIKIASAPALQKQKSMMFDTKSEKIQEKLKRLCLEDAYIFWFYYNDLNNSNSPNHSRTAL
jgi:hypothetical protein